MVKFFLKQFSAFVENLLFLEIYPIRDNRRIYLIGYIMILYL